jgi:predicted xylose isomerase-like sugar epimerase
MDFALNQKTVPKFNFAAFLDLAVKLGCTGIEPRNDLGRPFFDGMEPARAGQMARQRGLRLLGLSEVYPFNDWNEERRSAVARLIETAQMAGAETVSLIPRVDGRNADGAGRAAALQAVLAEILSMLNGTGVVGLVEPIGFSASTVKFQREATQAIESLGAHDCLGIVQDTFQHALAGILTPSFSISGWFTSRVSLAVPKSSPIRMTRSASWSTKMIGPTPAAAPPPLTCGTKTPAAVPLLAEGCSCINV